MFRVPEFCFVSLFAAGCIDTGFTEIPENNVELEMCDVVAEDPSEVETLADCEAPAPELEDPWDVAVEWQWEGADGLSAFRNVSTAPVIVHLTDDNDDGRIDNLDVPDIAFVAYDDWICDGVLVVLDGASGEVLWQSPGGQYAFSGVAAGDLDGDGTSELLVFAVDGLVNFRVKAYDALGQAVWTSEDTLPITMGAFGVSANSHPLPTVTDLEGDGVTEVIVDRLVLDGRDGTTKFELELYGKDMMRNVTVADMDLDGVREIILGHTVFDATGNLLWSAPVTTNNGLPASFNAVVDVDGDPEGELVVVGGGNLAVFESDGTQISNADVGSFQDSSIPCVADFDGDGEPEIAWGFNSVFQAMEFDGTAHWTASINNGTGGAGCSAFDLNRDGAFDIVYADETALRIFDGRTGETVFTWTGHGSGTVLEYPVLADIDQDDSVEIIVASDQAYLDGNGGITAFGHRDGTWLASGTTWPVYDFSPGSIDAADELSTSAFHPWQRHNMVRARPALFGDDAVPVADLQIEITDVCAEVCSEGEWGEDAAVILAVQVSNIGLWDAPGANQLHLYALDGEEAVRIDTREIGPVAIGQALLGAVFEVSASQLGPDGLRVEIEPAAEVTECATDNNTALWFDHCD